MSAAAHSASKLASSTSETRLKPRQIYNQLNPQFFGRAIFNNMPVKQQRLCCCALECVLIERRQSISTGEALGDNALVWQCQHGNRQHFALRQTVRSAVREGLQHLTVLDLQADLIHVEQEVQGASPQTS